ncbi:MAG: right-handed parallel beta-helix repeat-containing protein [Candidatus Tenebribacter burtonii]|jgi:hypothetical protein|nr:right-handed parallel beta-helix repeat-containing protein [Candidatus Tenebribacter burtonii]
MKKMFVVLFIFVVSIAFADTNIPGGDVSGTWTSAGSPYLIDGEITLQSGSVLTIEPGVTVNFQDHYKFMIYGQLLAEGAMNDTIVFTAADTTNGWHSLRFVDTESNGQDSSKVVYCKLEYGKANGIYPDYYGGAIYLDYSSDVLIENSHITHNISDNGGGIYLNYSSPTIKNNLIDHNYTTSCGGGIHMQYSNPVINGNTINNNHAVNYGGGILSGSSSPLITNNYIMYNTSDDNGGGFKVGGSDYCTPIISNNVVCYNYSDYDGGAGMIGGEDSNTLVINNIFSNNVAYYNAGGLKCSGYSNTTLINNLITDNTSSNYGDGGGIQFAYYASSQLVNNTICDNIADDGGGISIGCYSTGISMINCIIGGNTADDEGDQVYLYDPDTDPSFEYNDIEGGDVAFGGSWHGYIYENNIDEDPLFVGTGTDPYSLLEDSPCIDAGIPDTTGLNLPLWDIFGNYRIWDGNGNGIAVIDMGAYEYGAPPYVDVEDNIIVQTSEIFLQQNFPNPFNPSTTISFSVTQNSDFVLLEIYNIKGQKVKKLVSDQLSVGQHSIEWNGNDNTNKPVSSGVYFYKLNVNGKTLDVKKCLLLK